MPGYVREEIETSRSDMSLEVYRKSIERMNRVQSQMRNASTASPTAISIADPSHSQPAPGATTPQPTPVPAPFSDPAKRQKIRSEVKNLFTVFSSGRIYNFASSPIFSTTAPGSKRRERIVDIDFATPDIIPPSELQSFYAALTNSVSKVSSGEDPLTRTATGYTVRELRFENWRAINRLLFEAELFEKEAIERRVRGIVVRAKMEGVVDGEEGDGGGEMKKVFEGEEKAKKRIEEVRKRIQEARKAHQEGEVGWRKEELKVRGLLGRDVSIEGVGEE
ncbi:hypothetical protein HOY82DRAFT_603669 [Tuber indicum]|nr:hypothetical protein HOY82DRAFT_603669 [Tuber indicum]